ncbi:hypothetical protein SLE2022_129850 [Rubroshorea leprosula]
MAEYHHHNHHHHHHHHHHHRHHHHQYHRHHHKEEAPSATPFYLPQIDYKKEAQRHKNLEHLAELGAVAAGIYAVHELHMVEKDPEHAQRHIIKAEAAAAVAVGAEGFALHEHHEWKEAMKHEKAAHGRKHHNHHLF